MTAAATAHASLRAQAPARFAVLSFFALACVAELGAIYVLTGGSFAYSLDDAYIHLAVADNLLQGTYGVNPGEFSTPCSSILWPFLLVPFQLTPLAAFAPLLINLAAAATSVVLFQRIAFGVFRPETPLASWCVAGGVIALVVSSNVLGLAFTGMEHSLQLLSVVAILYGVMRERQDGRIPAFCWLALVAAPWLRYESAMVSCAFAAYFWARGHRREVVVYGALSASVVLAFTAFLWLNAGTLLPGSVVAKAVPVGPDLATMLRARLALSARAVVETPQALLLAMLVFGFAVCFVVREQRTARWLAAALAGACMGHMLVGQFGLFGRYESYIWTLSVLGLAWLVGEPLRDKLRPAVGLRLGLLAVVALLFTSAGLIDKTIRTPLGARDIYSQQHQMHRFAADVYRKPVAVNDLGWVAYQNEAYVLDLVGLASKEALRGQRSQGDGAWIAQLVQKHGIGLVMIYEHWFPQRPKGWIPLGTLHMPEATSAAGNEVAFFATSSDAESELRPLLASFAPTLPADVVFISRDPGALEPSGTNGRASGSR